MLGKLEDRRRSQFVIENHTSVKGIKSNFKNAAIEMESGGKNKPIRVVGMLSYMIGGSSDITKSVRGYGKIISSLVTGSAEHATVACEPIFMLVTGHMPL